MADVKEESKADAQKAEAQKKAAAVEGAQSVAQAVQRVADAAVAEVQKVKPQDHGDFTFSGTPGARFQIIGNGFGPSGTVRVNGVQVETLFWNTQRITGNLPADAKSSGSVEVHVAVDKVLRGTF